MHKLVAVLFVVLFVVHHDFWNWSNGNLVFGFIPVGLAYHAAYSVAAGLLWLFAVKFAWPHATEAWADGGDGPAGAGGGSGDVNSDAAGGRG